ncbi:Transferase [Corchorus olitorius]|uniref:Transferase n=1 Tax=Corchorus olitorius TaxID=93759 RepID=A0A1R3GJ71_9ROSI|nr:Transferase [Corchorus olitorius]
MLRIISSNIVQAVNHKELSRIDLTPWDLQLLPIGQNQKGLLFQKPIPLQEKETDENTLIHHLKASLSKTLDYFPPLAGRLAIVDHEEDDSISYFIDCNNAGALFIHAAVDSISISDIIKPVYVPHIVHSFFPLNDLKNYEGVANPLLGIQVTDLADEDKFIVPPLQERVFHFTKENIAKLKAKANAEVATDNISSLQAVLSHI